MKGGSNIVSAIHSLKQAYDFFESFERDHPASKAEMIFSSYRKKIEWIYRDILTYPHFTEAIRVGIRKEWGSDVFALPALNEKIPLLNPDQRQLIETIVDALLQGETLNITADVQEES